MSTGSRPCNCCRSGVFFTEDIIIIKSKNSLMLLSYCFVFFPLRVHLFPHGWQTTCLAIQVTSAVGKLPHTGTGWWLRSEGGSMSHEFFRHVETSCSVGERSLSGWAAGGAVSPGLTRWPLLLFMWARQLCGWKTIGLKVNQLACGHADIYFQTKTTCVLFDSSFNQKPTSKTTFSNIGQCSRN